MYHPCRDGELSIGRSTDDNQQHRICAWQVAESHPDGDREDQAVPVQELDKDEGGLLEDQSKIHQTIMMDRIGCRIQLPTTNLILPNGVDSIQRRVIIHYIN